MGRFLAFYRPVIKKIAEETGFKEVRVSIYGNALAATAFIQGVAVEDLTNVGLLEEHDDDYQVTLGLVAIK